MPLAERLIDKYFAENEVDSEAEVELYFMVMDKLGKTEKKLRILEGPPGTCFLLEMLPHQHSLLILFPVGRKLKDEECNKYQMNCLVHLKRWDEAVEKLTALLVKTPDQWSYIRQYISCQIMRCCERRKAEEAETVRVRREKELQMESGEGQDTEENDGHGEISPPEEEEDSAVCGSGGCGDDVSSWSWNDLK